MGVHLVPGNEPIGRPCELTIIITTDNNNDDDDNNNKNKTLFIDLKKKIDYLQIQEYEILKYIPYVHFSCLRKRIVVKWLSKDY